jgi:hypothetical protein
MLLRNGRGHCRFWKACSRRNALLSRDHFCRSFERDALLTQHFLYPQRPLYVAFNYEFHLTHLVSQPPN